MRSPLWRIPLGLHILLLFTALDLINLLLVPQEAGFLHATFHPYWVLVLWIPSRLGLRAGIGSGALAAAHLLWFTFQGVPSRSALEQRMETGTLGLAMAFMLVGVILGATRQHFLDLEKEQTSRLAQQGEEMKQLTQRLETAEQTRKILEARIVGETATVRTFSEAAQKLEALDPVQVYEGCLELLGKYFQVEQASLYMVEGKDILLRASRGWSGGQVAEGRLPIANSLMQIALQENRIIMPRDVTARKDSQRYLSQYGQILAMIPVRFGEKGPIGVVNIERMPFLSLTKPTLELMELVVNWAGRALGRAELVRAMLAARLVDEELGVYTHSHFEQLLKQEFIRAKQYHLNLTLSLIKVDRYGFLSKAAQQLVLQAVVSLLKRHLQETDMIFRYRFEGIFALLIPMRGSHELEKDLAKVNKELSTAGGQGGSPPPTLQIRTVEFKQEMKSPTELLTPALSAFHLER